MADWLAIFGLGFMQRALLAGLLIAVVCGLLGVFVVLRRTAPLGDALAHVSFGGLALGIFVGVFPLYIALVVAVAGGVAIRLLQERRVYGELSLTIVQAAGLAAGTVLVSVAGGLNVDILSFLFGGILAVSWTDVTVTLVLLSISCVVLALLYKEFFLMTFDPEGARVSGLPVRALDLGFTVMTAVAVVLAMRVVGILLVSALLVVPAATALQLRVGLRGTLVAAIALAALCVFAGLLISVYFDVATSGAIVLVAIAAFAAGFGAGRPAKTRESGPLTGSSAG